MPTYEYACKDCGERLEIVQSFRDDALTDCPRCQGALRKVFSAAGIIFKGSGWHVKDYASSGSRTAATGNSGDGESGGESGDDSGSKERATKETSGASSKESSGSGDTSGTSSTSESSASSSSGATSTSAEKKSA